MAETVLALLHLHACGLMYRDLNVSDGHQYEIDIDMPHLSQCILASALVYT
jgi:hypothetical protein